MPSVTTTDTGVPDENGKVSDDKGDKYEYEVEDEEEEDEDDDDEEDKDDHDEEDEDDDDEEDEDDDDEDEDEDDYEDEEDEDEDEDDDENEGDKDAKRTKFPLVTMGKKSQSMFQLSSDEKYHKQISDTKLKNSAKARISPISLHHAMQMSFQSLWFL